MFRLKVCGHLLFALVVMPLVFLISVMMAVSTCVCVFYEEYAKLLDEILHELRTGTINPNIKD